MNLDEQRRTLEGMRQEITERLERTGDYGLDDSLGDELSELSLYDNHPADIGSEVFERGKDLALRDADKLRMQDIDRALEAMQGGTYGTCQMCGGNIPEERLEAYPQATLCIACKLEDERTHPDRDRPMEEEFLTPGFARTNTDNTDMNAFDGEDAWQAVERFNRHPGSISGYEFESEDEDVGIVDPIDQISNEEYRRQLPD